MCLVTALQVILVPEIVSRSRLVSADGITHGRIFIVFQPVETAVFRPTRVRTRSGSKRNENARQRKKLAALAWPHRHDRGTDAGRPRKGLAPTTWDLNQSFPR